MARPERFELPTTKFVAWYSIQLSYGRFFVSLTLSLRRRKYRSEAGHFVRQAPVSQRQFKSNWRRERDSNPRSGYKPNTPLAGEPLRPLGHLSDIAACRGRLCNAPTHPTLAGISRRARVTEHPTRRNEQGGLARGIRSRPRPTQVAGGCRLALRPGSPFRSQCARRGWCCSASLFALDALVDFLAMHG